MGHCSNQADGEKLAGFNDVQAWCTHGFQMPCSASSREIVLKGLNVLVLNEVRAIVKKWYERNKRVD